MVEEMKKNVTKKEYLWLLHFKYKFRYTHFYMTKESVSFTMSASPWWKTCVLLQEVALDLF